MTFEEAIYYENKQHGHQDGIEWNDENFQHLTEEEINVGSFNINGEIFIEVFGSEDNIPHFHFSTKDGRNGCFIIGKAENFNHGKYKSQLSKKELKALNDWLNKKPDKKLFAAMKNNYEVICELWNSCNSNQQKQFNMTVPDYSLVKY